MFTMNVPKYLWGDAILTIAFLINHLPSRTLTFKSPLSMLTNKFPHLNMLTNTLPLKTFGCTAFFHIHSQHRTKLDPWAIKTIFLGYSPTQEGYQCYCPQTKKMLVIQDVTFFEKSHIIHTLHQGGIEIEKLLCGTGIPLFSPYLRSYHNLLLSHYLRLGLPHASGQSSPHFKPHHQLNLVTTFTYKSILEIGRDLTIPNQQELRVYSKKKSS